MYHMCKIDWIWKGQGSQKHCIGTFGYTFTADFMYMGFFNLNLHILSEAWSYCFLTRAADYEDMTKVWRFEYLYSLSSLVTSIENSFKKGYTTNSVFTIVLN